MARWVLRSSGTDPATVCRARAEVRSPLRVTPALVLGLGECGDLTDAAWLRAQLDHPHTKVHRAAARALDRLKPPAGRAGR
ncbi:hypothetical protein [Streptacidiphilus jiangxiensis]|uniref:hypothetical protein n=1 Tax=Streptacidiphilus jiangxiensis TaxID=235985 RepID=UPI000694A58E|nr:hypothetical protein [Streptacidiphilus jiangxiensis]